MSTPSSHWSNNPLGEGEALARRARAAAYEKHHASYSDRPRPKRWWQFWKRKEVKHP